MRDTNFHQWDWRPFAQLISGPFYLFLLPFYFAHPGIVAEKGRDSAFATTAIFCRFPNKNPENATLVEKEILTADRRVHLAREKIGETVDALRVSKKFQL
jgi:hypothetical protein